MKTTINLSFKKLLSIVLCLDLFTSANAQDIIVRNDSTHVQSTIEEIDQTTIKYRLFNYAESPRFVISKNEVAYVKYKNGKSEQFTESPKPSFDMDADKYNMDPMPIPVTKVTCTVRKGKNYDKLYQHKNYLGINYLAFLNTAIGFNYMHDFKTQHLILNIPVAFGL